MEGSNQFRKSGTGGTQFFTVYGGEHLLCRHYKTHGIIICLGNNDTNLLWAWKFPYTFVALKCPGDNYIRVTDVRAGCDIRNGERGKVIFESGSNTVIEKTGTVTLSKGVTSQVAQLPIDPGADTLHIWHDRRNQDRHIRDFRSPGICGNEWTHDYQGDRHNLMEWA